MVGRLVEEKNVGGRREDAHERGAPRLAAREAMGFLVAREAELVQEILRAMRIIAWRRPRLDEGARGGEPGEVGLLREIADSRPRLDEARAAIGLREPRGDPEQRRLARPVASDEAQAIALGDRQLSPLEERR